MKKNAIIIMSALLSAAVIAALCIVNSRNDKLFNANVKALADTGVSWSTSKTECFNQFVVNTENTYCLICGACTYVLGKGVTVGGYCKNGVIKIDLIKDPGIGMEIGN